MQALDVTESLHSTCAKTDVAPARLHGMQPQAQGPPHEAGRVHCHGDFLPQTASTNTKRLFKCFTRQRRQPSARPTLLHTSKSKPKTTPLALTWALTRGTVFLVRLQAVCAYLSAVHRHKGIRVRWGRRYRARHGSTPRARRPRFHNDLIVVFRLLDRRGRRHYLPQDGSVTYRKTERC